MKWPRWRIDMGRGFRSTPHSSRRITASTCERRTTPGTSISSRCQATRCTHPTARECWSRRAISSLARRRWWAAALSHEWGIAVRHGCFCANPYVFHLLHMSRDDVVAVEGEVTAGRRKALPGAVRASLAPYNTEAEVDRFLEAVRQVARGRIKATYEQAADGTYAPSGGWPRIQTPLHAIVKH